MFTRFAASARNFLHAEEGAVAIQLALTMVVLIGMGALAIDVGYALYVQRHMQAAADASAFSAAIATSTGHPAAVSTEAIAVAGASGFVNGSNGVVVTFNSTPVSPPATAADAANASAVQVIIRQSLTLPLVSAVCPLLPGGGCSGAFSVGAQAVATVGGGSTPCAVQLSSSANPGVTISNGATITLDSCGLQVCSSGSTALSMTGGTQIDLTDTSGNLSTKQNVSVAGTASLSNGAAINGASSCSSPSCKASQATCLATVNPYSAVTQPTPTGTILSPSITTSQTISAGQWTGGVTFGGGATITMNPGIYYVDQGAFTVGGGATLKGTGVTIVLAATGNNYATVYIANGGAVTLTAPTTGTTAGIAFFGDPVVAASNNGTETFTGGAVINVTGALYFPQQTVVFAGGVNNPSGCTQLIAGIINFSGGANFSNNCAGAGTSPIGGGGATMFTE